MAIEPIYHRPGLYDEVLPRYEFAGLGDEELLRHELDRLLVGQRVPHALELGCGTGRMTKIICEFADELTCVDNSTAMLEQLRTRHPDLTLVHADARTFVELSNSENPPQAYDLIAACWSLNYPLLACFETNDGTRAARS